MVSILGSLFLFQSEGCEGSLWVIMICLSKIQENYKQIRKNFEE